MATKQFGNYIYNVDSKGNPYGNYISIVNPTPVPVTTSTPAPVVTPTPVSTPTVSKPTSTPVQTTTSTPPIYNTSNGFLTDYGVSIGAKATQAGDPRGTSTPIVTPAPVTTYTPVVAPKITTTPTTAFTLTSGNLQQGSTGDSVKQLQTLLGVTSDGSYGPQTKSAVMAFQEANGLTVDGIVGPQTAAALAKGNTNTSTPINTNTTSTTSPIYDTKTGFLTDYGVSIGAKPVQAGDTGKGNSAIPNQIDETKQINTEANADMNSELTKLLESGKTVDTSNSAKLAETITSVLTTVGSAPKVPSAVELAAQERQTLGIDTLENQNNDVTAQIAALDANNKALQEKNTNRVQGMSQINRRKSADQINYETERAGLVLEQNRIADQLNTKYGVLNTFMTYNQTDYSNAVNAYNGNYSRAIDLINLFKGVQDTQKSEIEKTQDDAKANLQIVMKAVGSADWSTIDPTNQALITKLETQSGLPSGFTQAIVSLNNENSALSFQSIGSSYTDTSGNKVTPVYYKNPSTGVISAQLMTLGSVQQTPKSTTTSNADNVANFTSLLKTGKDGEGTVFGNSQTSEGWADPAVYITAFNNWPGTPSEFLAKFPVKTWIRKESYQYLPESIRPTTTSSSSTIIEP